LTRGVNLQGLRPVQRAVDVDVASIAAGQGRDVAQSDRANVNLASRGRHVSPI
jgi:hypothetical protein